MVFGFFRCVSFHLQLGLQLLIFSISSLVSDSFLAPGHRDCAGAAEAAAEAVDEADNLPPEEMAPSWREDKVPDEMEGTGVTVLPRGILSGSAVTSPSAKTENESAKRGPRR